MDGYLADWLFGSDLVSQGSQVSLEALVLALEGLHTGQVVAVVVGVKGLVLLLDPFLGLISIPAENTTYDTAPSPLSLPTASWLKSIWECLSMYVYSSVSPYLYLYKIVFNFGPGYCHRCKNT